MTWTHGDDVAPASLDELPSLAQALPIGAGTLGNVRNFAGARWQRGLDVGKGIGGSRRAMPARPRAIEGAMQGLHRSGAVLALWIALSTPALAQVTVIDGDTIRIGNAEYDLQDIDAPEYRQTCVDGLPAGVMAFDVLRELVRGRAVTCEPGRTVHHGWGVAVCRVDGLDLGAMMVRAGWAWVLVRSNTEYVRLETEAWAARKGVHGHDCLPAWDWRAKNREWGP